MGKTIVVGGGGFIGSHLAERAAIRGEEVVVIDDLSRTNHNYEYLKKNFPKINFVKADIRNLDSFSNYFTDAEKIFHTAGQVAVTTSVLNPKLDYEINSTGTFNVCEAARRANTNPAIVYCSTNKVLEIW